MLIPITAKKLTLFAVAVAKKNNIAIPAETPCQVAKRICAALYGSVNTKRIKPKRTSGTGFWQGLLLNYIQNNGNIVFPIKLLHVKNHPCVEIPDWVVEAIKTTGRDPVYTHKNAQRLYKSEAWRRLRYDVLKEQGGVCQLCGRGRKHGVVLHVDHIIPLSVDWSKRLDRNNLQVLCEDCNLGKSNSDSIKWR